MERYSNFSGQSAVYEFQIGGDNIHVKFKNGRTYVYTYSNPGSVKVEKMKILARNGRGLNSFINTDVKDGYSHKY